MSIFSTLPAHPVISSLLALSALHITIAHAAPPQVPGAGSILQENQPAKPPAVTPSDTGLTIEQTRANPVPASASFTVSRIQIEGNIIFDTPTLHELVASAEGKSLTLAQLSEAVDRITSYYHEHGYPLTRAVIPAQTIQDGTVRITVIEARYGQIKLDNHSRTRDSLLRSTLAPLQAGQAIEQKALDRTLLLLSDIPDVNPIATLKPGDGVGTSDLAIEAVSPQALTGSVALDDFGNSYTGQFRLGGTVNYLNPLHRGDVLSASVQSSGVDMGNARLSYELLLNGLGTRLAAAFSALHYRLGESLSKLDGHGTAEVGSLWIKHPWVRSPNANLFGQLDYDHKQLDDDIGANNSQTRRHLDNLTVNLIGDWRDASGVISWNMAFTAGHLAFDNAAAQMADAGTARTLGSFQKWTGSMSRLQDIDSANALYLAASAQWSEANLDASEKMVGGGPYSVRAYDMGALSGDTGLLLNLEWRHRLGQLWGGSAQTMLFLDSEHVIINKRTWTSGQNEATLSGIGLGFFWQIPSQWNVTASVAIPVGETPELLGMRKSVQGWLEINRAF